MEDRFWIRYSWTIAFLAVVLLCVEPFLYSNRLQSDPTETTGIVLGTERYGRRGSGLYLVVETSSGERRYFTQYPHVSLYEFERGASVTMVTNGAAIVGISSPAEVGFTHEEYIQWIVDSHKFWRPAMWGLAVVASAYAIILTRRARRE